MKLILRISFRNLLRHKNKSLVIGTILFLGTMFMTFFDGAIAGREKEFKENFIDQFIGDIVIMSNSQKDENIFPDLSLPKPNKIIKDINSVEYILKKQNAIEKFLPITLGHPMILSERNEGLFINLIGTDFNNYREMFKDNIILIEGEYPKKGERGVLLNSAYREYLYNLQDIWILPKGSSVVKENLTQQGLVHISTLKTDDSIVVMPVNPDSFSLDTRLPVIGIYKFRHLNFLRTINQIVDLESFRECFGYYNNIGDNQIKISKDDENLFKMGNIDLDNSFTSDSILKLSETRYLRNDFTEKLHEVPAEKKSINTAQGAFNFILVKLKKNVSLEKTIQKLNQEFQKANTGTRAVSWEHTSGIIHFLLFFWRSITEILINSGSLVVIIIIVNTINMAVAERSNEIGMMRAVGAKKGFIGMMIAVEIVFLFLIFGGAGLFTGAVLANGLSIAKITANNEVWQIIFGGETFQPLIDRHTIFKELNHSGILVLITMLYPVFLARRVKPLDAINRE